jgi:HSP20 family molecular chaperone IbpA
MASLSCLFHPHHVRLRDKTSYQPLLPTPDDIYYAVERRPSHKGLFVPKFDVSENSQAFFLTGEFPGIVNKKQVTVEWLEEELLIVRARTDPLDLEMNWKIGRSTEQTRGDVQGKLPQINVRQCAS